MEIPGLDAEKSKTKAYRVKKDTGSTKGPRVIFRSDPTASAMKTQTPISTPLAALLENIEVYQIAWEKTPFSESSRNTVDDFIQLIRSHPGCAQRFQLPGHLTGSTLITTRNLDTVLLTHHKKLNRWLQLGGHADGDPNIPSVAMKEAQEESGLDHLDFFPLASVLNQIFPVPLPSKHVPLIFDMDIHMIPEHKSIPEHFHYDIRYLVITDKPEKIKVSEESHDIKWFSLSEVYSTTSEQSMYRQFDKLRFLRKVLNME